MLTLYYPSQYKEFDLSYYNVRYVSVDSNKEVKALFIAMYDKTRNVVSNIEIHGEEKSPMVARDMLKFYDLLDSAKPVCIEFMQEDGDEYNKALMMKLAKKYGYEVYYDSLKKKYKLLRD